MKFKHFLICLILLLIFSLTAESIRKERKTDVPDPNFQLNHLFLNNGALKIGINLNWGGAIDFISYFGGPNIVDRGVPDSGRAIQISLYDGNDDYSKDNWRGEWGWNPVQAGDRYLNVSGVINYDDKIENLIYTKCAPLEWSGKGVSDIIVEQWVSLQHQTAIKITYKITHTGDDSHTATRQEFPCVYLKTPFIVPYIVVYQGDLPWTNDINVEMFQQKVNAGELIYSTENWISLVDYQGYGITLHTQTKDENWFNLERWQKYNSFPMNLVAAHTIFGLNDPDFKSDHNFPTNIYETTVFLIFGHWQEARKIIYLESLKRETVQLK